MKRQERLYIVDYSDSLRSKLLRTSLRQEGRCGPWDGGRQYIFPRFANLPEFKPDREREGMTASLFPRIISGERSGKNRAHIRRWKIVKFQNACFNLVKLNSAYEVKIPRPPKVKKEEMSILPRPPFVREMRALALRSTIVARTLL